MVTTIKIDLSQDLEEVKVKKTWQALFNIFREHRPLILNRMGPVLDMYEELKYLFFKLREQDYYICYVGFSNYGIDFVIIDDDDTSDFEDRCLTAGSDFYVNLYICWQGADIELEGTNR